MTETFEEKVDELCRIIREVRKDGEHIAPGIESAGRRVIEVDARYTSQECPACGNKKKKSLSERKHACGCGYSTHRDTAAAQIILARMEPLGAKIGESIPCLV